MFSLRNKTAVITGGGSGIGKAIATLFAKQGATVHILELNEQAGNEAVADIKEFGSVFSHACDVGNQKQVIEVFNGIGKIDILVNNAGIAHIGKADTTAEE